MPEENQTFNLSSSQNELAKQPETAQPSNQEPAIPANQPPATTPANQDPQPASANPPQAPSAITTGQPAGPQEEVGFIRILKETFIVFKSKLWIFIGLSLLNIIIVAGLYVVGMPIILMMAIDPLGPLSFLLIFVLVILTVLISWFFFGAIGNQAASVIQSVPVKVGQSFASTAKNTFKAINLVWKIFIYSGFWLVIIIPILFAVVNTVLGGAGAGYTSILHTGQRLLAQGLISPMEAPSRIGAATGNQGSSNALILMLINFALGLSAILIFVWAGMRSLRAVLAFPLLLAQPEMTAREALNRSKELTKKKWWLMYSFITVFTVLLAILPGLLTLVAGLPGMSFLTILSAIVSIVISLSAYGLMASFLQVFAYELGNPLKRVHLHWSMVVLAIIAPLLPFLLTGAIVAQNILAMLGLIGRSTSGSSYTTYTSSQALQNEFGSNTPLKINNPTSTNTPASSFTEQSGTLTDTDRIAALNKWVDAIEKYKTVNNEYPLKSSCLSDSSDAAKYFDGDAFNLSFDKAYVSGMFGNTGLGCPFGAYQYFGDGNYAVYTVLDDKSKNNTPDIIKTLADAMQFKPAVGGKYFVILKLNPATNLAEFYAKNDALRISDMDTVISALDSYKKDNGKYPDKSGCTDFTLENELQKYLPGGKFPVEEEGLKISGSPYGKSFFMGCDMYYQNLGSDSFALYSGMQDTSKNNTNKFLQSLNEAEAFKPASGGQYYVMLKLNGSQNAAQAPVPAPTGPKVKRSVT